MKYSLFIVNLLIFVSSSLLRIQSTSCYIILIVVPAVLCAVRSVNNLAAKLFYVLIFTNKSIN